MQLLRGMVHEGEPMFSACGVLELADDEKSLLRHRKLVASKVSAPQIASDSTFRRRLFARVA